ncbi:MAG: class I SAM-dependent methyltransferase, partial [Candidatus Roizmanbacteria bacterium]|nr:class I SAM-dependent methyltransferase [Candidatus Roizmanbacteria bacterium]
MAHAAQYKIFGIEPSQQLVRHAKKHFGVHTFLGSLTKYTNSQKKQFDIVTCIHVIEHVTNPKQFITLLLKIVKPGGLLYIETPNSDSHLLYVERESYTFLIPPDHLWLFSQQSIKQLLPKYSSIISINTYSYSEHLMGIIKRIIKSLSLSERSEESTERNEEKKREEFTLSNSKGLDPSANHFRMIQKFKKNLSYLLFDRTLAPFLTG